MTRLESELVREIGQLQTELARLKEIEMDEHKWLTSTDPAAMVNYLTLQQPVIGWQKASERKLRLFAVACCKAIWPLLTDARSRNAVAVAERYADGLATKQELHRACYLTALSMLGLPVGSVEELPVWASGSPDGALPDYPLPSSAANLLREIFGNPWKVAGCLRFKDECRCPECWPLRRAITPNVLSVATSIYEENRWGELGILGDGLEESGCRDETILNHCRGLEACIACGGEGKYDADNVATERVTKMTCRVCHGKGLMPLRGPHCRGCAVVDLLLGKS